MNWNLLQLLGGSKKTERPGEFYLKVLSAKELLEMQAEVNAYPVEEKAEGLWSNACLLARAVYLGESRAFSGGKQVLAYWSAEKIAEEVRAYRELAEETAPELGWEEKREAILQGLRDEPIERIRWKVLRRFSALPTEQRARDMTEGDYLYCAAQMILDREEQRNQLCPSCREKQERYCPCCGKQLTEEEGGNPQFDLKRFEELKKGG